MKPLFKNKTTLTKENYMKLVEFHQKKNNWKYWLYTIIFCLLLIINIAYQLVKHNYGIFTTVLVALIVFILYRLIYPYYKTSKELQSKKVKNNLVNYYFFYDKYFKVRNASTSTRIKYHKLYKTYESEDFFYLYFDKTNAFIVDKSGFEIGDSKSFGEFLKSKMRLKFKK